MTVDTIKRALFLVLLVLLQALVFNHIHIFGFSTPLLYLLLPLSFDSRQKRWSSLLWCFPRGILTDIFSNPPGMASASMTVLGLLQPPVLRLFIQKDEEVVVNPSVAAMGWLKYVSYTLLLTLSYSIVFFTLEFLSFHDIILWVSSLGGSTLLTVLILVFIDRIRGGRL